MIGTRYMSDFALAVSNLWAQKTRTVRTAMGIIFGVGAVIGMLAIGAGAREESLKFIETLGVRNLLIESRPPERCVRPRLSPRGGAACPAGGGRRPPMPRSITGSSRKAFRSTRAPT